MGEQARLQYLRAFIETSPPRATALDTVIPGFTGLQIPANPQYNYLNFLP